MNTEFNETERIVKNIRPQKKNRHNNDDYIRIELDKVVRDLHAVSLVGNTMKYEKLYSIQQALLWVLHPDDYRSPYETAVE